MNELLPQVRSKNQQLLNDFESGNTAALVSSYYDEDASLVTPDGNVINGRTNIAGFFGRLSENGQDSLDVRPLSDSDKPDTGATAIVGISGDLVCVLGLYAVSLVPAVQGLPEFQALTQGSGKRVVVFRRRAGELKAVIDMFA